MTWFDRLKASLGSKPAAASAETQDIEVAAIGYSLPTIAADALRLVAPTRESFEGAPQFHEDEWCQIECLPAHGLGRLQSTLAEYKAFERAHRRPHGWSQIFARQRQPTVLIDGEDAVQRLATLFGASRLPAPILTTSSQPLGQVDGGFALKPSSDVLLYGLAAEQGITALGAMVHGDDMQLSRAFAMLNTAFQMVMVDWRQQLVLCSVGADGNFGVWRP